MDNDIALTVYLLYFTGYSYRIEALRGQIPVALVISGYYKNNSFSHREPFVARVPSHLINVEIYVRVRREYHVIYRYYYHFCSFFYPFLDIRMAHHRDLRCASSVIVILFRISAC